MIMLLDPILYYLSSQYRRATRATAMGNMHTSYKAMVYTIIYIYRLHPAVVTMTRRNKLRRYSLHTTTQ